MPKTPSTAGSGRLEKGATINKKKLKVVVMSKIYKMVKMVKSVQIALQSFRSSCTLQEPVL